MEVVRIGLLTLKHWFPSTQGRVGRNRRRKNVGTEGITTSKTRPLWLPVTVRGEVGSGEEEDTRREVMYRGGISKSVLNY